MRSSSRTISRYDTVLGIFLISLACSYLPVLTLGTISGVHIDMSLVYLTTAVFVGVNLLCIANHRRLSRRLPLVLLGGLAAYSSLSIFWSGNHTRGLITSAFLWLLVGLVCSMTYGTERLLKHSRQMTRLLAYAYGICLVWALWQLVGDSLGVSSGLTLLPGAYRSAVFGVARPTGFALEPQFFASLLLIPLLWSFHYLLTGAWKRLHVAVFVSAAALQVLTLSRGGLLAAGIGMVVLAACQRPRPATLARVAGLAAAAVFLALLLQYTLGAINQRDAISGPKTVQNSLEQLSLGVLKFPSGATESTSASAPAAAPSQPVGGYVSSSTDSRISMSAQALALWTSSPRTVLFGVGSGSFGASLHQTGINPSASDGTVANNTYLETLTELGLVGFMLWIGVFGVALIDAARQKRWLPAALLVSFLVQWCFFSGNANVIHVWTILGIVLALSSTTLPKNHKLAKR